MQEAPPVVIQMPPVPAPLPIPIPVNRAPPPDPAVVQPQATSLLEELVMDQKHLGPMPPELRCCWWSLSILHLLLSIATFFIYLPSIGLGMPYSIPVIFYLCFIVLGGVLSLGTPGCTTAGPCLGLRWLDMALVISHISAAIYWYLIGHFHGHWEGFYSGAAICSCILCVVLIIEMTFNAYASAFSDYGRGSC
jgi:hypothetical protein